MCNVPDMATSTLVEITAKIQSAQECLNGEIAAALDITRCSPKSWCGDFLQILYNHETLLTIPEGPPKGVIFVLASCDTFVLVWGFPSHGCKRCVGVPSRLPAPRGANLLSSLSDEHSYQSCI